MCKRRWPWLLLVALLGVALAVYFEPSHCVRGWLRGEAFYDGRPTSYWRGVIQSDLHIDPDTYFKNQPPNWWGRCKNWVGYRPRLVSAQCLVEAPDAALVLRTLTIDEDEKIAGFAKDALHYHATRDRPRRTTSCHEDYFVWIGLIYRHNYVDQGVGDFFK
jgi:hypothetical protein